MSAQRTADIAYRKLSEIVLAAARRRSGENWIVQHTASCAERLIQNRIIPIRRAAARESSEDQTYRCRSQTRPARVAASLTLPRFAREGIRPETWRFIPYCLFSDLFVF
jgi:hypothetical protein